MVTDGEVPADSSLSLLSTASHSSNLPAPDRADQGSRPLTRCLVVKVECPMDVLGASVWGSAFVAGHAQLCY